MNRKRYSELTADILSEIPDADLELAVVDYIQDVKLRGDYSNEYDIISELSAGQQAVYTTWILEAEVNNGGFTQYFFNTNAQFLDEVLAGLKLIRADGFYRITQKAIEIYKSDHQKYAEAHGDNSVEAFLGLYNGGNLEESDKAFFSYPDNLSQLRITYIREHPAEFIQ